MTQKIPLLLISENPTKKTAQTKAPEKEQKKIKLPALLRKKE